ncbi:uncharacterized protein BDR25DRAFT_307249 [Lindgomyces ingoldianus]|uniref:Uncharacterized protein n=1 Tax=Lindgomyces ingoldianus TaxID=673940 RepID=A0ACB6QB82_9PLEO|nr:uncharacterized protein BDR25DRAFT_307249 [Lindgomyces ingoldianus]KAF2464218.1 hypothetical protein BDR25DRAFT_307249 [Lindgomyces ingoldianus]
MSTNGSIPTTKTTLWIWASGLYPRRLTYYFSAKRLPLSILKAHNIHLIPITSDPETHELTPKPGFEDRPAGCTLPVLRIEKPGQEPTMIYESCAIMEYFEEKFPARDGYVELLGNTPEQRARTRDILLLLNDAITWANVAARHADPRSTAWSGMTPEEQAPLAAKDANRVLQTKFLAKLEKWVQGDVGVKKCSSLSGEGIEVSVADVAVLAGVKYVEVRMGRNWVEGYKALGDWVERAKKSEWFVEEEEILKIEADEDGLNRLFVQ